ncbi:GAF domain-containing protein, partial [Streptosporangium nondiastaticum]|uniref:GAF domain-containing protein n=1 Tax=Streptosporangium nondiastaticum TaxID=35764 RepID=UPI0011B2249E
MGLVADDIGPVLAREQFFTGAPVEGAVRGPIFDSWQRSRSLGLSPDGCELPYFQDLDLDGRLVRAATPVLDRLQARFAGRSMNVALADGRGAVLQRRFGDAAMVRQLAPIQSVPGFVFAEKYAGTNGIGLALADRRLVNVYGAEHFAERSQSNACAAIPIRDLLNGRIEGVLCFGFPRTDADASLDIVIRKAAGAIERRLLEQSSARERALLQAYLDARRRAPAGTAALNGQPGEPLTSGLGWRDRMILEERATELIASAQRAAVEVSLPGGRRVTLLSHPVTTASGVEGVVVEAALDTRQQSLALAREAGTGTATRAGAEARDTAGSATGTAVAASPGLLAEQSLARFAPLPARPTAAARAPGPAEPRGT